jgi:hypothetical protein
VRRANSGGRRRDEWLEELPPDEVSELEGLDAAWEAQYAREDAAAAEAAEAAAAAHAKAKAKAPQHEREGDEDSEA